MKGARPQGARTCASVACGMCRDPASGRRTRQGSARTASLRDGEEAYERSPTGIEDLGGAASDGSRVEVAAKVEAPRIKRRSRDRRIAAASQSG